MTPKYKQVDITEFIQKHEGTVNPTVNNDGVDTAGLGKKFRVGDYWANTSTDIIFRCDDNSTGSAVWTNITAGNGIPIVIQGSEESEDTETAISYPATPAYRFSPTLEVAKYKVDFSCEIASDNTKNAISVRIQIDDTTTLLENSYTPENANTYRNASGIYFLNQGSASTVNFDFDIHIEQTPYTAKIRRKRIILIKVVE